jgi:hypothetical protein
MAGPRGVQQFAELFRRPAAAAYLHQGGNENPDHGMEKPVRRDPEMDLSPNFPQGRRPYFTTTVLFLFRTQAESGEVVISHEHPGRLPHDGQFQRRKNNPDRTALQSRGMTGDAVEILTPDGAVAGVKTLGYPLNPPHGHICGQKGIQTAAHVLQRQRVPGAEAGHLSAGMNTCIGAAGRHGLHRFLKERLQALVENTLNRPFPRLYLPSGEIGAIIFQRDFDIPHGGELNFPVSCPDRHQFLMGFGSQPLASRHAQKKTARKTRDP